MIGGNTIQNEKKYYNQQNLINMIHDDSGYSVSDITKIMRSLRAVVVKKLGETDSEIKIFPGLSINSVYISSDETNLNFCKNGIIQSDYILSLNSKITDRFRKEIRENH